MNEHYKDEIRAVYTDGGVIGRNPSKIGGTWAFCFVGGDGALPGERWRPWHPPNPGRLLVEQTGVIIPKDHGLKEVTNNQSEFYAVMMALWELPAGWRGPIYCDSEVTIKRIFGNQCGFCKNIPEEWSRDCWDASSKVSAKPILVKGHPTKKLLDAGQTEDGRPVSPHNVWCDKACTKAGEDYLVKHLSALRCNSHTAFSDLASDDV